MRLGGILGLTAGLVAALLLQTALLAAVRLPLAAPDLLLVVVVALGFARGPRPALVAGFGVGLAADVIPPAAHAVGREAFVLCLVGYLAGRAVDFAQGSAVRPILTVACLAALTPYLYALIGFAVGDGTDGFGRLAPAAVGAALYAGVLAPFVVPLVQALTDRGVGQPIGVARPGVARGLPRPLSRDASKSL